MSKTKSLKKKTTGFDIMYRVVTALMAIAIYPVFYFGNLLTFEIAHTGISNALGQLGGLIDQNAAITGSTLQTTYDSISLYKLPDLIDLLSAFTNDSFDFKSAILQNEMYRPAVVAAALLGVALITGLVVLVFAICSNKSKIIAAISGTGFLFTVASYISFTNFFANKLLSGEMTLSELLNIDGIIASTIVGLLGEVVVFTLDSAFFGVMFLLLGICLWSVCVIIVNASDEKEKQMKAMAKQK